MSQPVKRTRRYESPRRAAQAVRDHLVCRVVDRLVPVTQKHDIEGLVMGVE